jgi:curved DNA-binding protein
VTPKLPDYYECLQISRFADSETVHRVYRFLAVRFHPDNPKSGDIERFISLREAYEVLSDPTRRAAYGATRQDAESQPMEVFELRDFIDGAEQEANRRVGVLSILYHHRRKNSLAPGLSLLDLEARMSLPRDYLEFALWYLRAKNYVALEGNSDISISAAGVEYLESVATQNDMARVLLWPRIEGPQIVTENTTAGAAAR